MQRELMGPLPGRAPKPRAEFPSGPGRRYCDLRVRLCRSNGLIGHQRKERESLRERDNKAGAIVCLHTSPILVSIIEPGRYYARCLVCLEYGPVRPSTEEARRALQVLGARGDSKHVGSRDRDVTV